MAERPSKRKNQGGEMRSNAISEPIIPPHSLIEIHDIHFIPAKSRVVALFTEGAIVQRHTGRIGWKAWGQSRLVWFAPNAICNPVALSVTTNDKGSFLAGLDQNTAVLYIWSCATGRIQYTMPYKDTITHLALSSGWCIAIAQNASKAMRILCIPWANPEITPVILRCTCIQDISQVILDTHLTSLCWIVSATGVFSFDVTLPAHLMAPMLVLLDPIACWWPFTAEYRDTVTRYQKVIEEYHALSPKEKLQIRTTTFLQPPHPIAQILCHHAHPRIAPENRPRYLHSNETTRTEAVITTPTHAIVVNKRENRVSTFKLPDHLSLTHICKGMLVLMTTAQEHQIVYFEDHACSIVSMPIPEDTTNPAYTYGVAVPAAAYRSFYYHTGSDRIYLIGPAC